MLPIFPLVCRWLLLGLSMALLLASCAPELYSITIHEASAGQELRLRGRHLGRVREVGFGGVSNELNWTRRGYYYTWVPDGATSGPLTLRTPFRTITTTEPFHVLPPDSLVPEQAADDTPPCLVRWLALQPDGGILLGGDFRQLQGRARPGLARLHPDGRLDTTFVPPAWPVHAGQALAGLPRPDGRVLVSVGPYWASAGAALLLLGPQGQPEPGFGPDTADQAVTTLLNQPDGRVLVGHEHRYRYAPDTLVPRLQRLLPGGQPDTTFSPLEWYSLIDSTEYADGYWSPLNGIGLLARQADGRLLVCPDPSNFSELVWLQADGTLDSLNYLPPLTADESLTNELWGIFPQADGHAVLGRRVSDIYNTHQALQRLPPAAGDSVRWLLPPQPGYFPQAVAIRPDDKVLLATTPWYLPWWQQWLYWGRLPSQNYGIDPPNRAERAQLTRTYRRHERQRARQDHYHAHHWLRQLYPDGRPDPSFRAGRRPPNGTVQALAVQPDGKILVGGNFTRYQGHATYGILRLNADGSFDAGFRP